MKKRRVPAPDPPSVFALAISFNICYTFLEKQNMRQLSGLRPPESLSRWNHHLHNGQRPHRIDDIISVSPPNARVLRWELLDFLAQAIEIKVEEMAKHGHVPLNGAMQLKLDIPKSSNYEIGFATAEVS